MAVDRVRSNQQSYGFIEALFDIFAAHFVLQHQMGEDLDIEDHLFVVEGFS